MSTKTQKLTPTQKECLLRLAKETSLGEWILPHDSRNGLTFLTVCGLGYAEQDHRLMSAKRTPDGVVHSYRPVYRITEAGLAAVKEMQEVKS